MPSTSEPHFTDPHLTPNNDVPVDSIHEGEMPKPSVELDESGNVAMSESMIVMNPEERLQRFGGRLKVFNIGLLILVIFLLYDALTTLSPFQLRSIEINGLNQVSEKTILDQIQLDLLRPSVIRPHLFEIEQAALSHSWIKTAEASLTLSGKIRLDLTEYIATAVAVLDELKVVNAEGIPFATISPSEIGNFPLISGISPDMFNSSQKALYIGQYWLTQGIELARLVQNSRLSETKKLSDIHISKTGRYEIMLDRIRISLGVDMLKDRLSEVEEIMDNLDRKGVTAAYILLSDDLNRAIVKEIPITAEDAEPASTISP